VSDASSPQVRDHERREKQERKRKGERDDLRGEARERTEGDGDIGLRASGNETTRGPGTKGGHDEGVKGRPGVGEDQTSRRATGWSLSPRSLAFLPSPSPSLPTKSPRSPGAPLFFSCLSRRLVALPPAPTLPPPLSLSLSLSLSLRSPLSHTRVAILLALILFIFLRSCSSTMWFDDLRSL